MFKSLLRPAIRSLLSLLLTTGYAFTAPAQELSPRMQFLLGTQITHHGPNCWNSALVASGVLSHFRYTSNHEFRFLMESPACEKIPLGSQLPGDIQVYRRTLPGLSADEREVHANIWLNEKMAFNKKTDFATAPYEVTTHDIVNESYARTPDILRFSLAQDPSKAVSCAGDTCLNSIEYRRCGNIENLKRQDPHYSAQVEYLVQTLELAIQQQVRSPHAASARWNAHAERALESLDQSIRQTCGNEASFYCEYARNAQASIAWQIHRRQPNWLK